MKKNRILKRIILSVMAVITVLFLIPLVTLYYFYPPVPPYNSQPDRIIVYEHGNEHIYGKESKEYQELYKLIHRIKCSDRLLFANCLMTNYMPYWYHEMEQWKKDQICVFMEFDKIQQRKTKYAHKPFDRVLFPLVDDFRNYGKNMCSFYEYLQSERDLLKDDIQKLDDFYYEKGVGNFHYPQELEDYIVKNIH